MSSERHVGLLTRNTQLIDVLSYVDGGYEHLEDEINEMIETEMRTFRPEDYLKDLFPHRELNFSNSVFLKSEYDRVSRGEPLKGFDLTRYSLPPPSNTQNLAEWQEAINNACAQIESNSNRLINLELLAKFGANQWIMYNKYLEGCQKRMLHLVDEIQRELEELNFKRKQEQEICAKTLYTLQQKWFELVFKNQQLDQACKQLEEQIRQKGGTLPVINNSAIDE